MADLGFPRGGGANSPGGRQHTILPKFPKNCMKLKEFGPRGGGARPKFYYVDPPLKITFKIKIRTIFTIRKRSLGQGNIFTPVCHSVHGEGRRAWLLWGGHAWLLRGDAWLLRGGGGMRGCSQWGCVHGCLGGHAWDTMTHGDTVNERAVRILLECILVCI